MSHSPVIMSTLNYFSVQATHEQVALKKPCV